ncbi:hypothetical protein GCM10011578_012500 [Streptomyces fuscichromogenes]|uniref:Uncharacterized protein n=1 Tax=Streptomyces fuscichromogenes TaxID=1324013 RepID=A0A917X952_9ACTN|nr:hypothetical protein GCM10011578_012500 [Streptomyces fuscichromogenes]
MVLGCWRFAMIAGLLVGVRKDGRRRNAKLRGEGVDLDYRPSPRQLRRSSPKRMMLRMLAEPLRRRGAVSVCGTARTKGTESALYHFRSQSVVNCHGISLIMVAGSDSEVTQCEGAVHDDQRGL